MAVSNNISDRFLVEVVKSSSMQDPRKLEETHACVYWTWKSAAATVVSSIIFYFVSNVNVIVDSKNEIGTINIIVNVTMQILTNVHDADMCYANVTNTMYV